MEKIAIIVPVYNTQKYLKRCVRSILSQTFSNFVLILVDDGSTDLSGVICDEYAEIDNRVIVIHQANKGSVEARKTGILCESASECEYAMLVDADDTLSPDALKVLYDAATEHLADCTCGMIGKLWKGITFSSKYKAPCFQLKKERVYDNYEIMKHLYISCFGISNYPVSLCAKLYKTELLAEACDFPAVVRFMGDDLSVTLRMMPEIKRLVLVPKRIYNYRVGGGTSKFMPYMMDDFVSLYRYKLPYAEKYLSDQDAVRFMNIELINCLYSHLFMCAVDGKKDSDWLKEEIANRIHDDLIRNIAEVLCKTEKNPKQLAKWIIEGNIDGINDCLKRDIKKTRLKRTLKKLLYSL